MSSIVRAGLLVLLSLLAVRAFGYAYDGDLAWQRALGDHILRHHDLPATLGRTTFTAPDARWFPHEWIFATLWALAEQTHGEALFRAGCALVAFAALCIDALRARGAAPWAKTIALGLVALGMLPSFGLRAQVLGWPLLALLLLALESGPRRAPLVIAIAILWYNLHASAVIVPAIVLIHGAGRAIAERRRSTLASTLALTAATTLASAATPLGFAYFAFAASWALNPATNLIGEWQSVSRSSALLYIAPGSIFALIIAGQLRGLRLALPQKLLTLATFAIALQHERNISLFCIVAGPWAATALRTFRPCAAARPMGTSLSDRGLVALGAAGAILVAVVTANASRAKPDGSSLAVAQLIASRRGTRVVCEDFSWCSLFPAAAHVRVFMDGRVDGYPNGVVADYRRILAGDSAGVLDRWKVDAVLAFRNGLLARSLRSPGWQRIRGGQTQLFVRALKRRAGSGRPEREPRVVKSMRAVR